MIPSLVALLPLLSMVLAAPTEDYSYASDSADSSDSSSSGHSSSSESKSGGSYGSSYGGSGSSVSGYRATSTSGSSVSYKTDSSSKDHKTTIIHATTITTARQSYETPKYGSGSWNYGGGGDLNSCLSMCQAQFGGGYGGYDSGSVNATATESAAATHTIIVAPTQGVLRFVPFAVTANQGDELHFIWGAGPHTATLSQGSNACNRSTTSEAFDSGKLNATGSFVTKVVNDAATPQFHYCTVMQHCQKGMFGVVNPPSTNVSNDLTDQATKTFSAPVESSTVGNNAKAPCSGESVDCWIEQWTGRSANARRIYNGVKEKCSSNPEAWAWGGKWDMSTLLSEAVTQDNIIENVMYSRLMFAANPSMLNSTQPLGSNWVAAPELNSFLATNDTSSSSASSARSATSSAGASSTASAANANESSQTGGGHQIQGSVANVIGLVGLVVSLTL